MAQTAHKPENARQYEAFLVYRDLGYRRSQREVARQVKADTSTVNRWAEVYKWNERVNEHNELEKKRKEEGIFPAKINDPVLGKVENNLKQIESLIDSAFTQDHMTGKITPTVEIKNVTELASVIKEYRQMLDSYHKFIADYMPAKNAGDKVKTITQFNINMNDVPQEDRIKMMGELVNGDDSGGDKTSPRRVSDADFEEVPGRGDEDGSRCN